MKKKNLKNLTLRKESISNLEKTTLTGGITGSCICDTGGCPRVPTTKSQCCYL